MFRGFSHRAKGASHKEKNLPCQDCAGYYCDDNAGIAAVSDGHGSRPHFRSGKGSRIAVEAAIKAIKEFIRGEDKYIGALFADPDKILKQIESNIIYRWNERVNKHWDENPITEKERELYGDEVTEKISRIYGATLITAVITRKYWFALQIGDGACVTVTGENNAEIFVPEDEKCAFGFTTSLCDSNAIENFRHYFCEINQENPQPLGVIVSTDGVADAYDEKTFLNFNCKTINLFKSQENALDEIKKLLPILSEKGTRDDVSISGVYFCG